ncbi:MAG: DinB family protein [Caldilineaceae bacterium]
MTSETTAAITPVQAAKMLEVTVAVLQREVAALPVELLQFRPAPGEWCINEVIGHLIETEERGFAGRMRRMLAQDDYVCQPWDPDQVARDRRDDEKEAADLLANLAARRQESIHFVQTLTPADLARTAQHPVVGMLSVNDLLHEWVHHDRNHIKQIMSNVQARAWPHMGNSQAFTTL